jgi:hypothetical protein
LPIDPAHHLSVLSRQEVKRKERLLAESFIILHINLNSLDAAYSVSLHYTSSSLAFPKNVLYSQIMVLFSQKHPNKSTYLYLKFGEHLSGDRDSYRHF